MYRLRAAKVVLWAVLGMGLTVGVCRLFLGLGATTALADGAPWGLWKGYGVIAGIALAAGGFILTGTIHVFRLERFNSVLRPAVLTAFIGYSSAALTLTFDIGLPWRIWHPIFMWQLHSPLFEVAWCVMLYLTVVILEFAPILIEGWPRLSRVVRFMKKFTLPLVILGVMISCLHQSTLGTLFLITPYQLHPVWYSPLLPILFIVSAAGLGILVIILEFLVACWLYHRQADLGMLAPLGRAAGWVLIGYFVLKIGDLVVRGDSELLLPNTWEGLAFSSQMLIGVLVPSVLLVAWRGARQTAGGLAACSMTVIAGLIFQRVAVSGLGTLRATGAGYFPSWSEFALSGGILAGGVLFFLFVVEHFQIWLVQPHDEQADPYAKPRFESGTNVWLGPPANADRVRCSLAFVIAAAFAMGFLSFESAARTGQLTTPVEKALGGKRLIIDGNRDIFFVRFDHQRHVDKNGGHRSCRLCHHMTLPRDENTACSSCHRDMYLPTPIFHHWRHVERLGGNASCDQCHADKHDRHAIIKTCQQCHVDSLNMSVAGAPFTWQENRYLVVSYADAMHGLCVTCHQQIAGHVDKPNLGKCATCHREPTEEPQMAEMEKRWLERARVRPSNRDVIMPRPLSSPVDFNQLREK